MRYSRGRVRTKSLICSFAVLTAILFDRQFAAASDLSANARPRLVVLVVFDQMRANYLERWRGLGLAMYLGLGWLAIVAAPQLATSLSRPELVLLLAGGVLYTGGAVVLARKRPNPWPTTFGYHEVWHVFVVGAGACHYALVLLLVRT